MSQEIEIEFKNLLTEEEFNKILDTFSFPTEPFRQINHYFETDDFGLKAQHAALRIREKDTRNILTLKEPHPDGLLETHDLLTEQEKAAWIANKPIAKQNTLKQLNALHINVDDLKYWGTLITDRREMAYKDCTLVLDYSTYGNTNDYEFELEANNRTTGKKVFEEILRNTSIPQRKTPNKIKRFFKAVYRK